MRIGLVCPYDMGSPGGVQQLVTELADQLRAAGDEVVLVAGGSTSFLGGPGPDAAILPVGRAVKLRANKSRVPLTLAPTSWWKVRKALMDVDVVNVHEPMIPLIGWAGLATDKPTVATFHADAPRWAERFYRFAPLIGNRFERARLTAVSSTAAKAIPGHWGAVEIIPNAIDVGAYDLPVGRVSRRVAFLGRDEPRKGLSTLLQAWPRIREIEPDAELVVMGADRGDPPRGVTYKGPVTGGEKNRILASASVYVAPNTGGESFGMVIVEAMAAGCAVVASDLSAFREVLGDTGVTVPVGDPGGLATAVSALLANPDRARDLGRLAKQRARRFDWSEVVGLYRNVYEEALR